MEAWEREFIRDLAKKKVEMANTDRMKEIVRLWGVHNDGKSERPMMHFEMGTVGDKGFNYECKCVSQDARNVEWSLGNSMQNQVMVGDDYPVTADYYVSNGCGLKPFGIDIKRSVPKNGGVGFHIDPIIEELDTLDMLKESPVWFDDSGVKRGMEYYGELFGDILEIKPGMGCVYTTLTSNITNIMTMENMFMAMLDYPENFLEMMDRLSDDYVNMYKEMEKRNLLTPNCGNNWLSQGSFSFSNELKSQGDITLMDVWGYLDSQETINISPEMFEEFIFPAYNKVASLFGRVSYGCCEPVHPYWEKSLSKIENLRKISISPWCDEKYMGSELKGTKIVFLRKPSPLFLGGTDVELDEEKFREHIRNTMKAAEGCNLEFAFRDTYNLNGNLNKPRRAIEIVREEIENTWRG